ncbi:MAG: hypothetical protein A2162_08935 [Deltaproteobacteria bacterium RBG_13_52_11b]|nr:MAG: hypothetical protein A2162_08935 [Deltaproteobacteria bacterium RBG_13_52_11b]
MRKRTIFILENLNLFFISISSLRGYFFAKISKSVQYLFFFIAFNFHLVKNIQHSFFQCNALEDEKNDLNVRPPAGIFVGFRGDI